MYNKILGKAYSSGFTKEWFSWIEWITLTAALFAIGIKVDSVFLFIAGIISAILIFDYAIRYTVNVINTALDEKKATKWLRYPLAVLFGIFFPALTMYFIGAAIYGLVSAT